MDNNQAMVLDAYLKKHGVTVEDFARRVGVLASAVSKWRLRQRVPGPEAMCRIFEVTGGQVRPDDFYDLPSPKPRRSRRRKSA